MVIWAQFLQEFGGTILELHSKQCLICSDSSWLAILVARFETSNGMATLHWPAKFHFIWIVIEMRIANFITHDYHYQWFNIVDMFITSLLHPSPNRVEKLQTRLMTLRNYQIAGTSRKVTSKTKIEGEQITVERRVELHTERRVVDPQVYTFINECHHWVTTKTVRILANFCFFPILYFTQIVVSWSWCPVSIFQISTIWNQYDMDSTGLPCLSNSFTNLF